MELKEIMEDNTFPPSSSQQPQLLHFVMPPKNVDRTRNEDSAPPFHVYFTFVFCWFFCVFFPFKITEEQSIHRCKYTQKWKLNTL